MILIPCTSFLQRGTSPHHYLSSARHRFRWRQHRLARSLTCHQTRWSNPFRAKRSAYPSKILRLRSGQALRLCSGQVHSTPVGTGPSTSFGSGLSTSLGTGPSSLVWTTRFVGDSRSLVDLSP